MAIYSKVCRAWYIFFNHVIQELELSHNCAKGKSKLGVNFSHGDLEFPAAQSLICEKNNVGTVFNSIPATNHPVIT